mmetsp:Transcript_54662/g.150553  ORF Transcript_54662/g.150553 Transcript_54662/m.150553 type:complete len:158 (+) Transcript_54662:153-626(+)
MAFIAPALLPVGAGMFGLWYGTYDVTLKVTGTFIGTKRFHELTTIQRVNTFGMGLLASGAGIYARSLFDAPPELPHMERSKNPVVNMAKQSIHVMRHFPYTWYATSTFAAGFMSGMVVAVTRTGMFLMENGALNTSKMIDTSQQVVEQPPAPAETAP